ncbi:MAG TPA: right-handed parallel beta-helix repeat-containing protein, partial [Chloroflexota bacterium]
MTTSLILLLSACGPHALAFQHVGPFSGSTFFVSSDGTDTGRCILRAPCASLAYATHLSRPGDRVLVGSGTYFGPQVINASGKPGKPILVEASGTVDFTRRAPANDAEQRISLLTVASGSTYLIVRGFTVLGMQGRLDAELNAAPGGPTGAEVINDTGGGPWNTDVTFDRLTVRNSTSGCIKAAGHAVVTHSIVTNCGMTGDTLAHGIYCAGGQSTIRDNTVEGTSGYGIHCYGTSSVNDIIANNDVSGAFYAGILDDQTGAIIRCNLIHDNGWGMTIAPQSVVKDNVFYHNNVSSAAPGFGILFSGASDDTIANNTFYQDGTELQLSNGQVTGALHIENNIFVGNGLDPAISSSLLNGSNNVVDHNDYFHAVAPSGGQSTAGMNVDPLFVHPPSDLRLLPTSPLIGAGTATVPHSPTPDLSVGAPG